MIEHCLGDEVPHRFQTAESRNAGPHPRRTRLQHLATWRRKAAAATSGRITAPSNYLTLLSLVGYRHKVNPGVDALFRPWRRTPGEPPKTRIAILFTKACGNVHVLQPEAISPV